MNFNWLTWQSHSLDSTNSRRAIVVGERPCLSFLGQGETNFNDKPLNRTSFANLIFSNKRWQLKGTQYVETLYGGQFTSIINSVDENKLSALISTNLHWYDLIGYFYSKQLMEITRHGPNGPNVLWLVAEDQGIDHENAPIPPHNTVERTATFWVLQTISKSATHLHVVSPVQKRFWNDCMFCYIISWLCWMTDIRFDRNHARGTLACFPTVCLTDWLTSWSTNSISCLTDWGNIDSFSLSCWSTDSSTECARDSVVLNVFTLLFHFIDKTKPNESIKSTI